MYKKAWCTCKVVVLLNKPIGFLTFSLPLSLLKAPNINAPNVTVPTRSALVLTLKIRLFHSLEIWLTIKGCL